MATLLELMISIVGEPQNEVQLTVMYMTACAIAIMFFYTVLYMCKIASKLVRTF